MKVTKTDVRLIGNVAICSICFTISLQNNGGIKCEIK